MSLRGRLIAAFGYLLVLAVAALAIPLALNIERRAEGEVESRLGEQARLIASSVAGDVEDSKAPRLLRPDVAAYSEQLDAEVLIVDEDGLVVANSAGVPVVGTNLAQELNIISDALEGKSLADSVDRPEGRRLYVAVPVIEEGRTIGAVRIDANLSEIESSVRGSWLVLGAVGMFVVVLGLLAGWLLASSLASPLRNLAATAHRLGSGELGARADEAGPPEVAEVARAMNAMAQDLEATISAQQDFVANASHQLRTPLTGLRLRLEGIAADGGLHGPSAGAAIKEVDRLGGLVNDLLILARAGGREAPGQTVDLGALVREAADRWATRAGEGGQTVAAHGRPGITVHADHGDLADVLDNLIENALNYGSEGTTVTLEADSGPDAVWMTVEDDGPGIPPDDRERVFDRFYRGRVGKSSGAGTGLGLAIVREVVQKWGGRAEIESPEHGTRVTVRWPSPSFTKR